MLTMYVTPEGVFHRLSAATKLVSLAAAGAGLYFVSSIWPLLGVLCTAVVCYRIAGPAVWARLGDLKALAILMSTLFLLQGWLVGWTAAAVIVSRMTTLILLANLITLTTRLDDMTATMLPILSPLRFVGLSPTRLSFAMALLIRFVPLLITIAARLQEAWYARGGGRARWLLAVPLLVNALRLSDQVAEAVAARGGLNSVDTNTGDEPETGASTETTEHRH